MIKPYFETKLGKLYHGDCLEIMPELEPVDLVVTSPPYDNLRDYEGYTFDFKKVANGLYSVVIEGGVVVWVVGDETVRGSETGTSFKQALYFKKIGFNLHDTMIYAKNNPIPLTHNRYEQQFEYMFIFSKNNPRTFNPLYQLTKTAGNKYSYKNVNDYGKKSAKRKRNEVNIVKKQKYKFNIWFMNTANNKDTNSAIFPEQLAHDHIISWSNKNDLILDPMCGAGTTCNEAEKLNRKWIGIEISEKYCEVTSKRIDEIGFGLQQIEQGKEKEGLLY